MTPDFYAGCMAGVGLTFLSISLFIGFVIYLRTGPKKK